MFTPEFDDDTTIACQNGSFTLPEKCYATLKGHAATGFVYMRQDEDTLTISPVRILDGRRRALSRQFRARIFLSATRLAVVDCSETVRLMAVQWRASGLKKR